jgi:hypothetical protein
MGTLLQFPKIHRKEILADHRSRTRLDAFSKAAKQLNLTFEQIRELKPIPRSFFSVTQASLLLAEKRGELPQPILFNGKFCYSAIDMAEKALSKFFVPCMDESQGRHIAFALKIYRDCGDPSALASHCYTKKMSYAEINASFRELVLNSEEGEWRDLMISMLKQDEVVDALSAVKLTCKKTSERMITRVGRFFESVDGEWLIDIELEDCA